MMIPGYLIFRTILNAQNWALMIPKSEIFDFLRDLSDNNSKDWMEENRERYHSAKERWIAEIELILNRLAKHDSIFGHINPKATLSRINNNRRFHRDKPIYKDYFTCDPSLERNELSQLHISIGPNHSFVGAGLHHPSSETLKKFHQAIDYNGEEFRKIVEHKTVKDFFGELTKSKKDLKTAPKGFSKDHKHIDLLRRKSITLMRELTVSEICSDAFPELIEQTYLALRPFNAYLQQAISYEKV